MECEAARLGKTEVIQQQMESLEGWSSSMQSLSPGRRVLIPTHSGANFTTRCAARRPHVRGARSALGTEGGAQLPKEEIDLGKEGPEDKEERDSQAPEGLPF